MCSSTRGPAIAPSLVTCPTTRTAGPSSDLATRRSSPVHSRIWPTVPGAAGPSRTQAAAEHRIALADPYLDPRSPIQRHLGDRGRGPGRRPGTACAGRERLDGLFDERVPRLERAAAAQPLGRLVAALLAD